MAMIFYSAVQVRTSSVETKEMIICLEKKAMTHTYLIKAMAWTL
jgi:hypothetical protein